MSSEISVQENHESQDLRVFKEIEFSDEACSCCGKNLAVEGTGKCILCDPEVRAMDSLNGLGSLELW